MNFEQLTGKKIHEAFAAFDDEFPAVYEIFKRQIFRAQKKGIKKISAKYIFNWIRWECNFRRLGGPSDREMGFKINDAYIAHYARKFIDDYPLFRDLFETRAIRSA